MVPLKKLKYEKYEPGGMWCDVKKERELLADDSDEHFQSKRWGFENCWPKENFFCKMDVDVPSQIVSIVYL